ncbi:MAG: DUF4230 domain-containing protein [Verrucomicrobia bacterium]|nr:DUF4230 domain-containing protein [Verrucomicrobiota bacterium]MDE3099438.1 DUF4230 domain-containing protein [Verrucomicrobiota bacterium]
MQAIKRFFLIMLLLLAFAAGIYLGVTATHWLKVGGGVREENTETVVQQVQTLADLVTVKYVVEKVEILDDVKWYGENRVLFLAHGVVKAGMDLKKITPADVTVSGLTIRLRLPLPQITDAYLDDSRSKVIDQTTGLLRTFDKNLQQSARQDAVQDIRLAAMDEGILLDARDRARMELKLFLLQAGFKNVEFRTSQIAAPNEHK